MKINLEKIQELEEKYINNPIAYDTLRNLINVILTHNNDYGLGISKDYSVAITTLKELGIITEDKKPKQLNSWIKK